MKNFAAIFGKELRSFFASPVAYVMAGVWLLFSGFMYRNFLLEFNQLCLTYYQRPTRMPDLDLNEWVITTYFGVKFFVWLVVVPFLTMRLYAEEKKTGTIELLLTSPITTFQTLMGKFAACLVLFLGIEVVGFSHILIAEYYGNIDWGMVAAAYTAVLFFGGAFVAMGILASAMTENQIVAGVLSFFFFIQLWVIDFAANQTQPPISAILRHLSIIAHMRDFLRGVIDTGDVAFFMSLIAIGLFLTHTVLESRKWRH